MSDTPPRPYPGEFLRVTIGSTIHGLHVPGTDDLDLMGVCIEPATEALGLGHPFEQHVYRTQPEGQPSGPGDIDLTTYSLRKYLRLAANGNPTVLNLLFVPPEHRHIDGPLGEELRSCIPLIVSREAARKYRGYLQAQKERLLGIRGQKHTGYTRRLKYQAEGGWDAKYAMHMVRLGVQGVELLETGRITLPMVENREEVYAVRRGLVPLEECVAWAERLEARLEALETSSPLRPHPDRLALDDWLVRTYLKGWAVTEQSIPR